MSAGFVKKTDRLFGIDFYTGNRADLVTALLNEHADSVRLVVTCNLDHLYLIEQDPAFLDAYRAAWVATVDSRPLTFASKILYKVEPPLITGSDLFPELLDGLRPADHRMFFVCSTDTVAERLVEHMVARGFTREAIGVAVPPFGFEKDAAETEALLSAIRAIDPTHLFMGVGAPKSEKWIMQHRAMLPATYALGLGASLDFVAGVKTRAPEWVQSISMEWMYRLLQEPKRLTSRYVKDGLAFVRHVRRVRAEERRAR